MERFVCHFLPGWIFILIFLSFSKKFSTRFCCCGSLHFRVIHERFARIIARSWHNGNKFCVFPWQWLWLFSLLCFSVDNELKLPSKGSLFNLFYIILLFRRLNCYHRHFFARKRPQLSPIKFHSLTMVINTSGTTPIIKSKSTNFN